MSGRDLLHMWVLCVFFKYLFVSFVFFFSLVQLVCLVRGSCSALYSKTKPWVHNVSEVFKVHRNVSPSS